MGREKAFAFIHFPLLFAVSDVKEFVKRVTNDKEIIGRKWAKCHRLGLLRKTQRKHTLGLGSPVPSAFPLPHLSSLGKTYSLWWFE